MAIHTMERLKHVFVRAKRESRKTKTVKVLVMGKSGVGKTSVIKKLCHIEQEFNRQHEPTVYDVHMKEVVVDEYDVTVQFMDLGGAHVFPSMQEVFIRQADIFVLVYSVNDVASFNEVIKLRNQVSTVKGKHSTELSIIVVRNKDDLLKHRKRDRTRKNAVHQWCYLAHDVSAKTGTRINAVMDSLIEESKFIGNSEDLGDAQYSGRFVYDQKKDTTAKREQYHKTPTLFQNHETSNEMMNFNRRQSLFVDSHKRSTSQIWRRGSLVLSSIRMLKKRSKPGGSLRSDASSSSTLNDPSERKTSVSTSALDNKTDYARFNKMFELDFESTEADKITLPTRRHTMDATVRLRKPLN